VVHLDANFDPSTRGLSNSMLVNESGSGIKSNWARGTIELARDVKFVRNGIR